MRQGAPSAAPVGEFFAQPRHGAIEVMKVKWLGTVHPVGLEPALAGPVGARDHQAVQHGLTYGATATMAGCRCWRRARRHGAALCAKHCELLRAREGGVDVDEQLATICEAMAALMAPPRHRADGQLGRGMKLVAPAAMREAARNKGRDRF